MATWEEGVITINQRKKLVKTFIFILVFGLILQGCNSSDPKNEQNNGGEDMMIAVTDVYEKSRMLGRGLNLGNMLDAPYEGAWGIVIEESYFKLIKDKGFDSVRVPIRYSNKTLAEAPYTVEELFMTRVDWVIEQSLKQGLNVIVDLHHFDEMLIDPAGNKDRFLSIWQQVSTRYSEQPEQVYYEILNEPNSKITAGLWNEYLTEAIDVIRKNDPNRTLIVGGSDWNSIDGLYKLNLPEDDRNIIATIHYYGPMLFTHQGAEWMEDEYQTKGIVWPGPPKEPVIPVEAANKVNWVRSFFQNYNKQQGEKNPSSKEALIADLERAAQWGETYNRPLFLGEFGAYSTADMESRKAWTEAVREEAERLNMSWSYWEFGAGFGVYDRIAKAWNEELVQALIPLNE